MIIDTPSRHFLSCPLRDHGCIRAWWLPQLPLPPAPFLCLSLPCLAHKLGSGVGVGVGGGPAEPVLPSLISPFSLPPFSVSAPQTLSRISPAQCEGGTLTSVLASQGRRQGIPQGLPYHSCQNPETCQENTLSTARRGQIFQVQ